jgi:TPR repeat protein
MVMVRSTRQNLTLSLYLGMTAIALMLSAPLASAQQAAQPSAADSYRKAEEFSKKKNYTEAMRWYRMAADRGNAQAQVEIGNLYMEGQGVSQSYSEALRWFRLAANQGNIEAQNDIGFIYLTGLGVPKDYAEAMRWLRKSADQGNEVAQRNIGVIYLQGWGVTQDRAEAIRWFRKAAEKGDEDAKSALKSLGAK